MEKNRLIYRALLEIANRRATGHANPWPRIASAIEQKEGLRRPVRLSVSRALVFILVLLLAGATVAYAYFQFGFDPGLQAVDQAGLVSHVQQIAQPTLFTTLPTQQATPHGMSQSQKGITVTLDWAYADSNRVDFALVVEGLNLPLGAQIGDYICKPYVSDQEHIPLYQPGIETWQNGFGSIGPDQLPGAPIELTFEYQPQTDLDAYPQLNLEVDLTIGPCAPQWNAPDWFTGPWTGQTATRPPLIGNYHLSFQVPVSKGVFLIPNQAIDIDGVRIKLETISLSPSYTQVRLCEQLLDPGAIHGRSSGGFEATIQMDNQPPIALSGFTNPSVLTYGSCSGLGAVIPNLTQPDRVTIRVANYRSVNGSGQPVYIAGPWEFTVDLKSDR